MKLKLKAVALFSLAFWTDHYFLIDIDRGIFVDTISYGDFGISMIPAAFSLALSLALAVLKIHCSPLPPSRTRTLLIEIGIFYARDV